MNQHLWPEMFVEHNCIWKNKKKKLWKIRNLKPYVEA